MFQLCTVSCAKVSQHPDIISQFVLQAPFEYVQQTVDVDNHMGLFAGVHLAGLAVAYMNLPYFNCVRVTTAVVRTSDSDKSTGIRILLLLFQSLDNFVHSTLPQFTQLYK